MLNPSTMTAEQEQEARAQAFYLLKKYTSYTFLDKARSLYQGLLDAFLKEIALLEKETQSTAYSSKPLEGYSLSPKDYARLHLDGQIQGYKALLGYMIPIEEGIKLLRTTPHKLEAYRQLEDCTAPISGYFFGRGAHETGMSYTPFYQALGMVPEDSTEPDTGVIADVFDLVEMIGYCRRTALSKRTIHAVTWKLAMAYNYETLFAEDYNKAVPRVKRPYIGYIYPFNFPAPLPECPPHNTNPAGEVWSGKTIPTHGIWEPWLLNGKVGCPNYFLAGQTATEYQLEGTEDKEAVRWRLLWEDKRYLDGTIPPEEALYFAKPAPVATRQTVLSAQPGEAVPRAGVWQTPAMLENRTLTLAAGETLPYAQTDKAGNAVVWFWKAEK